MLHYSHPTSRNPHAWSPDSAYYAADYDTGEYADNDSQGSNGYPQYSPSPVMSPISASASTSSGRGPPVPWQKQQQQQQSSTDSGYFTQPRKSPTPPLRSNASYRSNYSYGSDSQTASAPTTSYPPEGLTPPLDDDDLIEILHSGELEHNLPGGIVKRNRKEYCVLTNRHLLRFKSMQKADSVFNNMLIHAVGTRRPLSSIKLSSDSIMVDLDKIVAVHESSSTPTAIRIDYISSSAKHGASLMIMTHSPDNQKRWLDKLRGVLKRRLPHRSIVEKNDRAIALERLRRHSDVPDKIDQMVVHKVVLNERRVRTQENNPNASLREVFLNVLLVIGKNNFYILPASPDDDYRRIVEKDRLGLMAISSITYGGRDDVVQVTVRVKGAENKTFTFASSWCEDIVQDLRRAINSLTQFYPSPPYELDVPYSLRNVQILPLLEIARIADRGFDKLLEAHCAALSLDKRRFSFTIADVEDVPGAKKLAVNPPNEVREGSADIPYSMYELLAIFRSLRHNLIFREISFANTDLSEMEKWTPTIQDGWAAMEMIEAQNQSALSNELHVMIMSNRKLRKLDLTNCNIGTTNADTTAISVIGRAMQSGRTGLNSIFIGQNKLTQADVDSLAAGFKVNRKAVKELSVANCQLKNQQIDLLLDTIINRSPEHLNTIDISCNQQYANVDKVNILLNRANHLWAFKIRKCDISLEMDTLFITLLQHLDIGGTRLNDHYVSTLCSYIRTPAFNQLKTLSVDGCNLNGSHFQDIFQSISRSRNRDVHLNAGSNPISRETGSLPKFCYSILQNEGPASISFARTEWDDPSLREFLECLRNNTIIRHLDLSYIQMQTEPSEDTVHVLSDLFERNTTLAELILTGEGEEDKAGFGKKIAGAFPSLELNNTLKKLDLTGNCIGEDGAFTLAEVLKVNKTLESLHVDGNKITMEGFKRLAEALKVNISVVDFSRPSRDLKYQLQYLSDEIKTTYQAESELAFMLRHLSGNDWRKAKEDLETQKRGRLAAEATRERIGGVIDGLSKLVEQKRLITEEANARARQMMNVANSRSNDNPNRQRSRPDRRTSWELRLDIPSSPTLTSTSGDAASPNREYQQASYHASPYAQYISSGSQTRLTRQPQTPENEIEPLSLGRSYYQTPNMD